MYDRLIDFVVDNDIAFQVVESWIFNKLIRFLRPLALAKKERLLSQKKLTGLIDKRGERLELTDIERVKEFLEVYKGAHLVLSSDAFKNASKDHVDMVIAHAGDFLCLVKDYLCDANHDGLTAVTGMVSQMEDELEMFEAE
mmetsp:Transcript_64078/g.75863  ORF Transcript_64078/g.75863 Transcript_64078/m.75863 type:complete len:141 (+) Transcript_64078:482-904(+)